MPGFFMDAKIPADNFASFSGEESQSSSDWGKYGFDSNRPGKRREKNRDAARKSRKKQTERADLLHEELQFLERSNAAFEKEIADLKAELQRYTTVLQQHEPLCSLPGVDSDSGLAGHVAPPVKALCSTSNITFVPTLNTDPAPVTSAQSLPASSGETLSEFAFSELLDSTEWTPSWEPGHWS